MDDHPLNHEQLEQTLFQGEQQFRQLAEVIEAVFWLADAVEPKILYVSPAYDRIWGRDRHRLYTDYDEFFESIHPADRERVRTATSDCVLQDQFEIEYRVVRPDGGVRWIRDRGFLIRDSTGAPCRLAGLAEDVSDRKQVEQERDRVEAALRESETKYRTLFNSISEGFCILERVEGATGIPVDFRYVEANGMFTIQLGKGDVIGKTARQVVSGDAEDWFNTYDTVLQTGQSIRFERIVNQGRVLELYAFRVEDGTQRRIGVISTDVTERKRTESVLRENERRQSFLLQLDDALRQLTDAQEIESRAVHILGESLGASRVVYVEVVSGGEDVVVHQNYTNGVAALSGRYHLEDYRRDLSQDHQAGRTQVVTDIPNHPHYTDAEKARYREVDIAAHIDVPLIKNNRSVALLAVHQSTPRQWTAAEVQRVEATAERTWTAIARSRAEAAVRESENRLRAIAENLPNGAVFIVDHELRYQLAAGKALEEAGFNSEDLVGKTIWEALNHEMATRYELYFRQSLNGEPFRWEHHDHDRDYASHGIPLLNDRDEVEAVLAVSYDITDRKQAEAMIAADLNDTRRLRDLSARLVSEDNIQVLYEEILTTAIALMRADAGSVQMFDPTTQELVMLTAQGFEHTMVDHFYRVNANSSTPCGTALAMGNRTLIDFDGPGDDPDGSLRMHMEAGYYSAQSTPLISRSGRAMGMVSTHWRKHHRPSDRELRFLDLLARQAADLIEQRQIEAERKQILNREQAARETAENANRIKDEFLAVLSHELRSPLNPILGWAKLLRRGTLDATKTQIALDTIERNAQLQAELISDLLDISRILRGKLSLEQTSVDLSLVIASALETVRLAAEAKALQITTVIRPQVRTVLGDAGRLQQVVWNLLSNAVKFTPTGGQVEVRLDNDSPAYAQITVTDTGKGINPDFLPYVFEHFRQEDGATTRKFGGLGLGLAIARQIVELHGGTIAVDSRGEGQGTTFTVRLPMMGKVPGTQDTGQSADDSPASTNTPLTHLKIFVVDDDADSREFVAFVLEQAGAIVTQVASGIAALQVMQQSTPDLIVSDIGMPEMDGYTFLRQVRSQRPTPQIPAIALTAYAGDYNRQQALQAGFQQHLSKPIEPADLVTMVVRLCGRREGNT